MREVDLIGEMLDKVNLKAKNISHALIDSDKKELIDSYIEGYGSIAWVNKPEGD